MTQTIEDKAIVLAQRYLDQYKERDTVKGFSPETISQLGTRIEHRRKYILVDYVLSNGQQCGLWMVDRETGYVYGIRGYGNRGRFVNTIDNLIAELTA